MTDAGICTACTYSYTADMQLDNTGDCFEICGKGRNYGNLKCDDTVFPTLNQDGDGCNTNCEVEDGYICFQGSNTTPDICEREIPEILYINVTTHDHIVVEFTEEIGYKEPFTRYDFTVLIQNSTGYQHYLTPLFDEDVYTFMPSKTISMYINWDNDTDHDNLILISQDPHSTIEITYMGK